MRAFLTFAALFCAVAMAAANPVFITHPVYIAGERLSVALTPEFATVEGHFRLRSTARKGTMEGGADVSMKLPLWIPRQAKAMPAACAGFFHSFHPHEVYNGDALRSPVWTDCLRLSVSAGRRDIPVSMAMLHDSGGRKSRRYLHPAWLPEGYACVLLTLDFTPSTVGGITDLIIRYRQPLRQGKGYSEFYYLPVFSGLPARVDTNDREKYSLELSTGQGARVDFGGLKIRPGQTASLPLSHEQPFTARVTRD